MYIREPIYVWNVDATGVAHAQQYFYQTFMMPNGDAHETGVVTVINDEQVMHVLEACYNHKVVPLILVLNHAEGYFHGVQYGRQFQDWNAMPGPDMRAKLDMVHQLVCFRFFMQITMMKVH